ncbi:MAG: DUF3488 and transglutaminase-like domain-containing protein [Dermatophilaceae bacterium]
MKGQATRGVDATLAAIATLVVAWPISTLLAELTWVSRTLLLLAVVALSGVGARALALRGWQVVTVQLVCVVLAASAIYGRGHLWHGLPTFETLGVAGKLVSEALTTAQKYAAPAPTTPGLVFVVSCALALVALAVDYLAVTRRTPSLAGLPLLTAFLASAANTGASLPVNFFLAAAAMWLILVARQGSAILRRWGTTVTVARTPVRGTLDSEGMYRYSSIARTLGAVALVAAVTMPVMLPQLPPRFFLSGLGRSPLAHGGSNVSGGVGFSLSINLAEDLTDRSTAPVLQYTTADTSPPPLRVAIGSFYRSQPGVWLPRGGPVPALSTSPDVPKPTGLLPAVHKTRFTMTFAHNLLDEPNLAVPYPLISADLHGVAWGADNESQSVRVAQRPNSYTASYFRLEPTATMLQSTPSLSDRDRHLFDMDLQVDGPSAGPVTALSERLTTGKTSDYDKAMAIQQYLRANGGFTYSLTLAPPAKDRSGKDAGFDPLTNFLVTKQGYCVQFATAMVMMSRAAGIPARMAIGFLPGTRTNGIWTVTASDAHAWPELYLNGIGWARFEPTPSRAAPPAYAAPATSGGTSGGGRPVDEATAPAPRKTAPKDLGDPSTSGGSSGVGLSPASMFRWLTHGWGAVLLGSLVGLFGSLVVPMAARWRRRRDLITARTAAQRVEVEWQFLTSSLSDLGITPAPSATPRQLHAYYDHEALLDAEASAALGRAVQTLERSRYAGSAPAPDGLAADARQVLRAAAATRRPSDRLRAALWPSRGVAQLRLASAYLVWGVRTPLRDANAIVRQRFSRRR